ncbi:MAG: glycoside hydrolase family 2 TIM barrel-domain containing protein [Gemmatimonadota bacterium]|jgi:hypothetical protein
MRPLPQHLLSPLVRRVLPTVVALSLATPAVLSAQTAEIEVVSDASGRRLVVDGEDLMVRGVNWDYFPIGTTTTYDFWSQPDEFIEQALEREMSLLQAMGGNAIRVYAGIPPRWVAHIYETYGIWSIVNHPVGRYGVTIDGTYVPITDYSDPATRQLLIDEVAALVEEFEGTPGLLMWLLGNENNYGLEWSSAETEDLPEGEQYAVKARYLYSLFGEVVQAIKERDTARPVAMANGDLQYLDIIADEVEGLDVFGTNVYRGISFRDLFERVEETLGLPVMLTEFGADAFNARTLREDQATQARYLIAQWQELYEQSAGKGLVGNSIGGLTFQWSDGWWKFGQEDRLDIQDINASWANDAYPEDFVPGENNMNEEWWGITAKGSTDAGGFYNLYPRAAFYAIQEAYELDPYAPGTDLETIRDHFGQISAMEAALQARGDRAALQAETNGLARFAGLRMELETYSTGGERIRTPEDAPQSSTLRPASQGFDTKQTFYTDFESKPAPNLRAGLTLSILGNVPENAIDELFYEAPGRARTITADDERYTVTDFQRLRVYSASASWDERLFRLDAFYRSGHYHWGYEGDFFNLYREANYGPNIDIYNGIAPVGFEVIGKQRIAGLNLAFGPELWWGANPAFLAKYTTGVGDVQVTGVVQEDFERKAEVASSFAVPVPPARKVSLHAATTAGPFGVDLGGIWSGSKRVGETFQIVDGGPGDYRVLQDEVKESDAFGAKAKLTYTRGRLNWYAMGSAMGIVAEGGYDQTQTFAGWTLKDNGSGNRWQLLSGFAVNMGNLQIAPNFMWQKPIVGPIPADVPAPGRPRNILDDPFSVRLNRETTAAELLVTWDPTPATWMYDWDSDVREDAPLALSAGVVFRRHHTTADAAIGILADGRTPFAFPGATPARDLWEVNARIVSKRPSGVSVIVNGFVGTGEPNGADTRKITRGGADWRIVRDALKVAGHAKFNDWGPYDYHRDFNLTFPVQLMGDVSWALGSPQWLDVPHTRVGIRGTWRTLDEYSPRYCPGLTPDAGGTPTCDPTAPGENGREWEIRTYLTIGM